jgi:UPF0755 protein
MYKNQSLKNILIIAAIIIALVVAYPLFGTIMIDGKKTFTINEGESLKSLSTRLEEEGLVKSSSLLRMYLSFNDKDTKVQLGEYEFSGDVSLFSLAKQITDVGPKSPLLSVTVPEGSTSLEIFQIFVKALPLLNKDTFSSLVESNNLNGKLFPSTYHLLPSYQEMNIITQMSDVYVKKVAPILKDAVLPTPLTKESDVLILASILEGEANTEKDMKIVAGILLERMRIGMPLQVDVAMETYKERGLPKRPINNPGLVAINAVLNPTYTEYLYYITGNDGEMYYAETFNDHKRNIAKYLK